ncbi:MAG: Gfo/Idh/MocA family oxidoreductase [Planctomycetales bacterium]|nr:Gfo/Idh/MocA family oxidoreductase [Planctomycetales bacterium]
MNRRRNFLLGVAAAAGQTALSARSYAQIAGANERVQLALIGCGGRGQGVAKMMADVPNTKYVALADVYDVNAGRAQQSSWGNAGKVYADFRHVLDRKDVHAVHVATPDHWHAIPAYLACLAGKDAYVEKPLTHNICEGRALVDAARENNRVLQTGTQHRSAPHFAEAAAMIREGGLGDVHFVRIWNYMNRKRPVFSFGASTSSYLQAKPAALDWDFYCGPAAMVPYERARFLGTFRNFYDYAGGYVADYGAHRFDSMRQLLGEPNPISASASGGRYLEEPGDTPDVIQATVQFPNFTMSYEGIQTSGHGVGGRTPGAKYYRMNGDEDRPHGVAIYGTKGVIIIDRIGFDVYPETNTAAPRAAEFAAQRAAYQSAGIGKYVDGALARNFAQGADRTDLHVANFIECIRTRGTPTADVEIGHRSCIIPHLINIAYRTNEKILWDAESETITNSASANALVTRLARQPWNVVPGT